MRYLRTIFTALTLIFAALGLFKLLPFAISQPLMFASMTLSLLCSAKQYYDRGMKRNTLIDLLVALFIVVVLIIVLF